MTKDIKFSKWRKRASNRLPELSQRVFALRTVSYPGQGFHWSMEKELGYLINTISNYDKRLDLGEKLWLQVSFSELFEEITKIEKTI